MKRVVEGVIYDTETATELAFGDHDHEMSQAWWRLYRTQSGAFFEVVADHDGVVEAFHPLTDQQARRFLEVNANHLVEEYFGPLPEPDPMRFSRRTVLAAIEIIEREITTHGGLDRFLLHLGPELPRRCGGQYLTVRFNSLMAFYDEQPDRRLDDGNPLSDELVKKAVSLLPSAERYAPWGESPPPPHVAAFLRTLDLDGFAIAEGALRRALPASLKLPEAEDEIRRLLAKHRLTVAKGHLDQAFVNHTGGHWAAANSQIRSFFEELLDKMAEGVDPSAASLTSGQPRRTKLAASGFLSRPLNEWDDNGLGFINGLVKRLHPHGSHPGLSDQDDSTFRLHTVLLTARLLLVRYDTWGAS